MAPLVSVIIPSYNHEKYIGECIQSVLNQTFQDFEIIITDDGSSDRTVKVIEDFTDPRIKLYKFTNNRGACIAGNNCLQYATGKYVAVISSDDAWYPEKLEIQVDYLENNLDVGVVFGKADWVDENGTIIRNPLYSFINMFEVKNRSRFEWLRYFFLTGNCLCHPCSLVRKECYEEVGLFNPAFASLPDLDFWIRICLKYDIHILDRRLVRFRKSFAEGNASGNRSDTLVRNRFELRHSLDHYLQITKPEDLLQIFPEADRFGEPVELSIPYFLARIAIDTGEDFKVLWGLDTIFSLLQNEEKEKILKTNYDFTFLAFIELSGRCDPYKLSTVSAPKPVLYGDPLRKFLSASKRYVKELRNIFLRSDGKPGMGSISSRKPFVFPESFNFGKKELIDFVYRKCLPVPLSFADLGGVWNVDGAYTFYIYNKYGVRQAFLVDFVFNDATVLKASSEPALTLITGSFGEGSVVAQVGNVDAVILFDVLLHQVKPDWDAILETYAGHTQYFIIYNQQWVGSHHTIRLLNMGREEYFKNVPSGCDKLPNYVALFETPEELVHPGDDRIWQDISSVWQWGISDGDLIETMAKLGFKLQYYKDFGRFGSLPNFANHGFVFQKY